MNVPDAAGVPLATDQDHLAAIAASVADFTARESSPARVRALRGRLPGHDRAVWRAMAALGWAGILVPEELGGAGLGLREATAIAAGLARAVMPEPFIPAAVLAVRAIAAGDGGALRATLLARIAAGGTIAALAWQERFDQAEPAPCATTARGAEGAVLLAGTKSFVAGAGDADGFVVSAEGAHGTELYWVERDRPGLAVAFAERADGTFQAMLALDGVAVPTTHRLASAGCAAAALEAAITEATIVAAADLLGNARGVFELTLQYLRTRMQFGRAIGSFQALQHRAVDCHVQIELAAAVLEEAVARAASGSPAARSAAASRAKARCAEAALLAGREAIQMHGAMGFSDECDVGLHVKRALAVSAWLGGVHHHRRRFARLAPVASFATPQRGSALPPRLRDLPRGTDWPAMPDEDFRAVLRDFIEANYPEEHRYLPRRARWHEVRDFYMKLAARGWVAPAWPAAWGGMGLPPAKQLIYIDEMERWGVGRAPDQGIRQLGAVLMRYGTEAQKAMYLPKILSFEHIWAQGYSEPNAGSDLASLTTSAVAEGDHFAINGSKIWTTLAQDATHIYVLCRTDRTAKKQAGISFIILDLKTPGITLRPIRTIGGEEEFCQVFFDNAVAPAENLVGGLNNGWTVAKAVLDFERLGIGSPSRPTIAFNRLTMLAHRLGLFEDAGFLDEFTRLRLNLLDHATLYGRFSDAARRGAELGADVSILKIWGMENFQRISEFMLDRADAHGAAVGRVALDGDAVDVLAPYYMSRLVTIGGGSNEIQRNIIARRVLNLPG